MLRGMLRSPSAIPDSAPSAPARRARPQAPRRSAPPSRDRSAGPRWAAWVALALWVTASAAGAEVPRTIGYQGFLRARDGGPVDSAKELTFSLYDSQEGGSPRWSESQVVLFSQGHYTVFLGDASGCDAGPCTGLPPELFAEAGTLFLELSVDGAPFRPRQRLTASPFALTARDVRGGSVVVSGVTSSGVDAGLVRADALVCGSVTASGAIAAGSVSTGALAVSGTQTFGTRAGQHVNLYGSAYGEGVQASTLYLRTAGGLAVYRGGVHADAANNPGGGTTLLTLDGTGALTVPAGISAAAVATSGPISSTAAVTAASVSAPTVSATNVTAAGTVTAAAFAGAGVGPVVYACPTAPGNCPDHKARRCDGQLQLVSTCTVWDVSGTTCVRQTPDTDCTPRGRLVDP